jgi:hypothetical protein
VDGEAGAEEEAGEDGEEDGGSTMPMPMPMNSSRMISELRDDVMGWI